MESQKCPMCNAEITAEILEKAIEEENKKKKNKSALGKRNFFGIFSGRSSPNQ